MNCTRNTSTATVTALDICLNMLAITTVFFAVSFSIVNARILLPCTHPLRIAAPQFFTHCSSTSCEYSKWSSWKPVPNSVVPSTSCSSDSAYQEKRVRAVLGNSASCNQLSETRQVCKYFLHAQVSHHVTLLL